MTIVSTCTVPLPTHHMHQLVYQHLRDCYTSGYTSTYGIGSELQTTRLSKSDVCGGLFPEMLLILHVLTSRENSLGEIIQPDVKMVKTRLHYLNHLKL